MAGHTHPGLIESDGVRALAPSVVGQSRGWAGSCRPQPEERWFCSLLKVTRSSG